MAKPKAPREVKFKEQILNYELIEEKIMSRIFPPSFRYIHDSNDISEGLWNERAFHDNVSTRVFNLNKQESELGSKWFLFHGFTGLRTKRKNIDFILVELSKSVVVFIEAKLSLTDDQLKEASSQLAAVEEQFSSVDLNAFNFHKACFYKKYNLKNASADVKLISTEDIDNDSNFENWLVNSKIVDKTVSSEGFRLVINKIIDLLDYKLHWNFNQVLHDQTKRLIIEEYDKKCLEMNRVLLYGSAGTGKTILLFEKVINTLKNLKNQTPGSLTYVDSNQADRLYAIIKQTIEKEVNDLIDKIFKDLKKSDIEFKKDLANAVYQYQQTKDEKHWLNLKLEKLKLEMYKADLPSKDLYKLTSEFPHDLEDYRVSIIYDNNKGYICFILKKDLKPIETTIRKHYPKLPDNYIVFPRDGIEFLPGTSFQNNSIKNVVDNITRFINANQSNIEKLNIHTNMTYDEHAFQDSDSDTDSNKTENFDSTGSQIFFKIYAFLCKKFKDKPLSYFMDSNILNFKSKIQPRNFVITSSVDNYHNPLLIIRRLNILLKTILSEKLIINFFDDDFLGRLDFLGIAQSYKILNHSEIVWLSFDQQQATRMSSGETLKELINEVSIKKIYLTRVHRQTSSLLQLYKTFYKNAIDRPKDIFCCYQKFVKSVSLDTDLTEKDYTIYNSLRSSSSISNGLSPQSFRIPFDNNRKQTKQKILDQIRSLVAEYEKFYSGGSIAVFLHNADIPKFEKSTIDELFFNERDLIFKNFIQDVKNISQSIFVHRFPNPFNIRIDNLLSLEFDYVILVHVGRVFSAFQDPFYFCVSRALSMFSVVYVESNKCFCGQGKRLTQAEIVENYNMDTFLKEAIEKMSGQAYLTFIKKQLYV